MKLVDLEKKVARQGEQCEREDNKDRHDHSRGIPAGQGVLAQVVKYSSDQIAVHGDKSEKEDKEGYEHF